MFERSAMLERCALMDRCALINRFALGALVLGAGVLAPAIAQDAQTQVRLAFDVGDWEQAFRLAEALPAPDERADWVSYLAGQAGDLPMELEVCVRGLNDDPCHPRLLARAANAALALGRGSVALDLAARLQRCAAEPSVDEALRQDLLTRGRKTEEAAGKLVATQALAAKALKRSRNVCAGGLALLLVGLLRLSPRAAKR